jgi:hypothetical protein
MPKGAPPRSAERARARESADPLGVFEGFASDAADAAGGLLGGLGGILGGAAGGGLVPSLSNSSSAAAQGRSGDISGSTGLSTGSFSVSDRGSTADARTSLPEVRGAMSGGLGGFDAQSLIWLALIAGGAWIAVTALRR